jgi:hypothetical protein
MEIKCICIQCGIAKTKDRFFYDNRLKRYSYRCKRCDIRNSVINRKRYDIRKDKDIQEIKRTINNDKSYMDNGIAYLAEIITTNIMRQRNIKIKDIRI